MTHPLIAELKQQRIRRGVTQTGIADAGHMSKTTVCELESGNHEPKLASADAYASALGLTVGILGTGVDEQCLHAVLARHQQTVPGRNWCHCGWGGQDAGTWTFADHIIGLWQNELWKAANTDSAGR